MIQSWAENPELGEDGKPDMYMTNLYIDNAKRYIQQLRDQRFMVEANTRDEVLMELDIA
jgi:hypothetical protein